MRLLEMSWPAVAALPRSTPIVIPIAALEQHGHHMPLFTDSILLGEICRRAEEQLHDRVLFAPLQWLGNSQHHLDFPGTMTAMPRTYVDLLVDMVENFLYHGFQRIVLLNGHGGNIVPSQQAVFELRQRHREGYELALLAATYWQLGCRPSEAGAGIRQTRMGHACEWETSMMLRIRPDLVGDYHQAAPVVMEETFEPVTRGWVTQDRSGPGHIGDPRQASAEKGETLISMFTSDVVALLTKLADWQPTPRPQIG